MAYTKSTDFAIKDNLLSGNPSKLVRGSEIDAEFNALEVEDALNLKATTAASTYTSKTQEQNGTHHALASVAGTDTITATATPTLTAYTSGQWFRLTPANTNTGAATINIDSLGAINIKKRSSGGLVDVVAGDLVSGQPYSLTKVSTAFVLNESRPYSNGADVASASTINLDTATGDYVRVTGTTAITAITLAQGEQRTIRFADALTFTHGASLILPGSSNITTAAGDIAVVRGEASSVVRCVSYTKAAGTPVVDSSTQILTVTPTVGSNQLTIAFPSMTLDFRSTTAGSGTVTRVTGTPANLVITNGSTLGTTNGTLHELDIIVMNNSGTLEGAIVNAAGGVLLDERGTISTTAEGGLGAADSASVIYSTTARSTLAYRVIGRIQSTQATAGAWVTTPSFVQGNGGSNQTQMTKMLLSASQATTSGTTLDITGIPSWAKKITLILSGFSTSGTSLPMVQLGTSGGIQTTAYVSGAWQSNVTNSTNTTGIILTGGGLGADTLNATLVLYLSDYSTGKWVGTGTGNLSASGNGEVFSGSKTLSGVLDRVRLTTVGGADTLDSGSLNVLVEGY